MEHIYIRMLGDFSLQMNDKIISDYNDRSKKVWLLLAYLIYYRNRTVPRTELLSLLYKDYSASSNPKNALKITLHRVRELLNQLSPSLGHQLILYTKEGYSWNNSVPITLDIDSLSNFHQSGNPDADDYVETGLETLNLYRGDFLNNLSDHPWVLPLAAYYQKIYTTIILNMIPRLSSHERHPEAVKLCRSALVITPYHEQLNLHLMQELLNLNDQKGALTVYEELSQRLSNDLGIQPGKEIRSFYRSVLKTLHEHPLSMDTIMNRLQETDSMPGALECEFPYFRLMCHVEARSIKRSGHSSHVALLSVSTKSSHPLSKQSLEKVLEQLGEQIRINLRHGDLFASCSMSQYIILLSQANYENSCKVCQRLISAYTCNYPNSPAKITFEVHSLTQESADILDV